MQESRKRSQPAQLGRFQKSSIAEEKCAGPRGKWHKTLVKHSGTLGVDVPTPQRSDILTCALVASDTSHVEILRRRDAVM
jgi:hypothetical protein